MRLMCPNCDAEYEVDASAIPESGRDVQCSNCGHAWFQPHPDLEADQAAEAALYDPPPPLSKMGMSETILPSDLDWQVESDDPEAILDAMGREARALGASRPAQSEQSLDEPAEPVPKHEIDPEALRILREEAEFETAQRALDQDRAEPAAAPVVARRVARLKGIQPPAPVSAPAQVASARLPKIEVVSATLRADEVVPARPKPKTGRGGIFTIFGLALAATGTYVFSPELALNFPNITKPLAQYVFYVDQMRDQLDILIPQGIVQLKILLAQAILLAERGITLVKGWF